MRSGRRLRERIPREARSNTNGAARLPRHYAKLPMIFRGHDRAAEERARQESCGRRNKDFDQSPARQPLALFRFPLSS
jgi:hypothetical protein